jgi:hypothetical protein
MYRAISAALLGQMVGLVRVTCAGSSAAPAAAAQTGAEENVAEEP